MTDPITSLDTIEIKDVTPRDGLQPERPVPAGLRANLALRIAACGLKHIEAVAFVSSKAVPAMAEAETVMAELPLAGPTRWWALVPNARGAELALAAGCRHLTVTLSVSDTYSMKNIGRSTDESLLGLREIVVRLDTQNVRPAVEVDVVLSCAFGSPFGDVDDASDVARVAESVMSTLPQAYLTLADTIGAASPRRVKQVVRAVRDLGFGMPGLHLHDTRGTALVNAVVALDEGVRRFDTATGGLGGSPFAPGAGGNLATEQLVMTLEDMGTPTGVDLDGLLAVARDLPKIVGHELDSRVVTAGPLPRFGTHQS